MLWAREQANSARRAGCAGAGRNGLPGLRGASAEREAVEGGEAEAPWLAAYTRPRHEEKVKDYWEARGIEVFFPCYQSLRRWSDRTRLIRLPLFPSYVFLRLRPADRQRAVQAPGFLWLVHNRLGPVRVDAGELAAIRRLLASGLEYDPMPRAEVGDAIEVVGGALKGCRGYLLRKDRGRIVLCVAAIQGTIRVQLPDPSWVVRLPATRAARPGGS